MSKPTNNDNIEYQMRPGSLFSDRGFIAETLKKILKTSQNDTEISIANDYIDNIHQIGNAEAKLKEVTRNIKILSEKRSVYSQLKSLRQQQEQLNTEIVNIDRKLLQLESTDFIKKLIKDAEDKYRNEIIAARQNKTIDNSERNKSNAEKIVIAERSKRAPYINKKTTKKCIHCGNETSRCENDCLCEKCARSKTMLKIVMFLIAGIIFAIINTLLRSSGILLGAIPTIIILAVLIIIGNFITNRIFE